MNKQQFIDWKLITLTITGGIVIVLVLLVI